VQEKKIFQEVNKLLEDPGIVISNPEHLSHYPDARANIDRDSILASIPENLTLGAKIIASIKHSSNGIQFRDDLLALDLIQEAGTGADNHFLSQNLPVRWSASPPPAPFPN